MSYIIWKGVNSNSIKGLIISKLPAISKPNIRTERIEIDGVDGDIINELGYESYDKTLEISLSYNYDINEVIKYFTGEGNLILSNEDDKYYKAKIVDKIDYESLLRFKTAKVNFHVQPFKYKVNEESVSGESEIEVNNEGLENSKPLIKLTGNGTVNFYLNDIQVFTYTFDEDKTVYIDSELQEAYYENKLKNRNMTGEFPILISGKNNVRCENTTLEIYPNSRWL